MRPVTASYLLRGDEAVIEISQASGLTLLAPEERNPMVATSYGTGQLVVDAVRRGAKHIIVGLGGSATSDAGMGMLKALVDAWAKQGTFDDIRELRDVRFTIASDVKNPLCGVNGAAHVFAPTVPLTSLPPKKVPYLLWCRTLMSEPESLPNFLPGISATTVLRKRGQVLPVG